MSVDSPQCKACMSIIHKQFGTHFDSQIVVYQHSQGHVAAKNRNAKLCVFYNCFSFMYEFVEV